MSKYKLKKKAIALRKDVDFAAKKYFISFRMVILNDNDLSYEYMALAGRNWLKAIGKLRKAEATYNNYIIFLRNLRKE